MFTLFQTFQYLLGFNGSRPGGKAEDDLSGVMPARSSTVTVDRISDTKAKPSLALMTGLSSHEVKINPLPNVRAQPCSDTRDNPVLNVKAVPCPAVRFQQCSDVTVNPLPCARPEQLSRIKTGQCSEPVADPPPRAKPCLPYGARLDPTHGVKTNPISKVRTPQTPGTEHLLLSSWGLPREVLLQYKLLGITSMFPWQHDCLRTGNVLGGTLFPVLHLLATY